MKIKVINGPNLNMLGIREPDHYGREDYGELCTKIQIYCEEKGAAAKFYQSNHEGDLVDEIHRSFFDGTDGIVINPGAYTHTSIALLDAVKAVSIPTVEVHISKLEEREAFRQISYIRAACIDTVSGLGTKGYLVAVDKLLDHLKTKGAEEK